MACMVHAVPRSTQHRCLQSAKQDPTPNPRPQTHYQLPDGTLPGFAVFEVGSDGWFGVTTYPRDFATDDEFDLELNKVRRGNRLYRRAEK